MAGLSSPRRCLLTADAVYSQCLWQTAVAPGARRTRGLEPDAALPGLTGSGSAACPPFLGLAMWSCPTLLSTAKPLRMLAGCKVLREPWGGRAVGLGCKGSPVLPRGPTITCVAHGEQRGDVGVSQGQWWGSGGLSKGPSTRGATVPLCCNVCPMAPASASLWAGRDGACGCSRVLGALRHPSGDPGREDSQGRTRCPLAAWPCRSPALLPVIPVSFCGQYF